LIGWKDPGAPIDLSPCLQICMNWSDSCFLPTVLVSLRRTPGITEIKCYVIHYELQCKQTYYKITFSLNTKLIIKENVLYILYLAFLKYTQHKDERELSPLHLQHCAVDLSGH